MPKITRDDIQRIGDEATLLHFLEEKLNLPIPKDATLEHIALPMSPTYLGLENRTAEQIIDCQDFSGLPKDGLGERRPFLIRFKHEQDYPEILRKAAEGLFQKNINPSEIFSICTNEHFQPFAFAYFNKSESEDWQTAVLTIHAWTEGNTRIITGPEHDFSVLFSSKDEPSAEPDDSSETEKTSTDYGGDPNLSKHLLIKLQKIGTPLNRYGDILTGVPLLCKDAFVIDEYTREQLIDEDPNSADLIEQFPDKPEKWRWELKNVIYIPNSRNKRWSWSDIRNESEAEQIFKETYPAISKHMDNYKNRLKEATYPVVFYWEFPPCGALSKLVSPKIIYRAGALSMQASYDTSHRFHTTSTHSIPTEDLSLLAILNSELFDWYARRKYNKLPKYKSLAFTKQNMEKAPIAPGTESQKAELSHLVQQILDTPNSPEVPNIEREIDQLVYKLYDLTSTEIALIEKGHNL